MATPQTPNKKTFKITTGRSLSKGTSPKNNEVPGGIEKEVSAKSLNRKTIFSKQPGFILSKKAEGSARHSFTSLDKKNSSQNNHKQSRKESIDEYINQYIFDKGKSSNNYLPFTELDDDPHTTLSKSALQSCGNKSTLVKKKSFNLDKQESQTP